MIDQKAFNDAWTLLCERFNKVPSRPFTAAYYKILSAQMDTDAFRKAAQRIFVENEFFPKPADFMDHTQNDETTGLEQWELALQLMRGYGDHGLNDEAWRVVNMLGGESALRTSQEDRIPFIRAEFLKLYGKAAVIARREGAFKQLPQHGTSPGLSRINDVQLPRQA